MSTATSGRAREYRAIPGYPGYDVSDTGQVRSWIPWKGTALPRTLRQHLNTSGYLIVRPTVSGRQSTVPVHRLVALAFLGEPSEVVRHLNDDRHDNRVENLAWGTRADNGRDSVRNGRHYPAYLTHCRKAGHPLSGPNLYVSPRGSRMCRACATARKQRRRESA